MNSNHERKSIKCAQNIPNQNELLYAFSLKCSQNFFLLIRYYIRRSEIKLLNEHLCFFLVCILRAQQNRRILQILSAVKFSRIASTMASPFSSTVLRHFRRRLVSGIMVHALSRAFLISSWKSKCRKQSISEAFINYILLAQ